MNETARMIAKALDGVDPFFTTEQGLYKKFDAITISPTVSKQKGLKGFFSNPISSYCVELRYKNEVVHTILDVCVDFHTGDTLTLEGVTAAIKVNFE